MQAEEFMGKVRQIVGDISFDGHLNKIVDTLDPKRQEHILDWISECEKGSVRPEPCKNHRNLIAFIYKSNDNRIRGILTKEKNAYFIELFLDKHKYYDNKRRYLGL